VSSPPRIRAEVTLPTSSSRRGAKTPANWIKSPAPLGSPKSPGQLIVDFIVKAGRLKQKKYLFIVHVLLRLSNQTAATVAFTCNVKLRFGTATVVTTQTVSASSSF